MSVASHPHLAVLTEQAVQIAWDYLERAGVIHDPPFCSRTLVASVEHMIQQGERKRLLLANRAITEYMRRLETRTLDVAS
jgi:hypothetical protein